MRNRYILLADVLLVALAAAGAYSIRFGWTFLNGHPEFWLFMGAAVLVKIPVFLAFGLYQRFWPYAGFWDLIAVGLANSAGAVLLGVIMAGLLLVGAVEGFSRSIPPMDWLLCLMLTAGLRASVRAAAEMSEQRSAVTPDASTTRDVLIVGAGDAGTLVAREMGKNAHLLMNPVGFLDDDPAKQGKRIYGVPVMGSIGSLPKVIRERPVGEVVIAMPTVGGNTVRTVVETCHAHSVPSQVMPGIYELLGGRVTISRLRKVDITDLLRRPQIVADANGASYLHSATVVITGAGGSIGAELCAQVAHNRPDQLVLVGHGENSIFQISAELRARFPEVRIRSVIADIRDRERIARILDATNPSVVFHAAAHKHVPLMEENACEAITNNVAGTRHVVNAALAAEVPRLVLVSTDKAVSPSSVMGASKRLAETLVLAAARKHDRAYMVVRFGNVLGSRGSVVPIFREQIERGGPLTVTHPDVQRYFMTTPEATHLVLEAGGIGKGGELFVLDMGEPVLLRELAADMIRLSGFDETEISVVYTGLRPGEKLEELLWEDGATVRPTERSDISVVSEPQNLPVENIDKMVNQLLDAAERDNRPEILRLLGECIPTARLN